MRVVLAVSANFPDNPHIYLMATWSYQSKSVISCYLVFQQSQKRTSVLQTKRVFTDANTSDKGTSFVDLNIKIIGSDVHTSIYDKRDDFGFPIVNFPWLSGDVPRLPSYGVYISQLVRTARCCTSVSDFHSKTLQITSKLLTQDNIYHNLRKIFGKFYGSYYEFQQYNKHQIFDFSTLYTTIPHDKL